MGLFDNWINAPQDLQEKCVCYTTEPRSVMIADQIKTLPFHIKLTLYACTRLFNKDKKDIKVTVRDVFEEYEKVTAEVNTQSLSFGIVNNYIKELELLGFLKCTYISKVPGRIRYIRIRDRAEIPKYVSMLKESLDRDKVAAVPYHL
jgi:Cdc6-like AAA superfamily ATPase